MKLTPWFPSYIKPVRSGVYEFKCIWLAGYAYWDNDKQLWANGDVCQYQACKNKEFFEGAVQAKKWRGIEK